MRLYVVTLFLHCLAIGGDHFRMLNRRSRQERRDAPSRPSLGVCLAQTLSPKLLVRRSYYRRRQQEKVGGMSIAFWVFVLIVCAYAGWESGSIQFGQLLEPQQHGRSPTG